MAETNEDQSKAFDEYEKKLHGPNPAAEPYRSRPSLGDVPNGWDLGVVPDASVPVNLRGNVCSGVNKPKSLKRFADE